MRFPSQKAAVAAAVAAAFGADLALAQSSATADGSLQSVTVTATKRAQLLTDVPQSVQAISAERLQVEGVASMSDIVQVVPGTSQTFKASPGFEVLQVRGISSGAVGDSLVGYYIDEIAFGLPNLQYIPPVNVFDLSRVEVLRGPQGTLYGQSSMGGAIRLITRKPDLKAFSGEVRLGAGQIDGGANTSKADLMLNVPLAANTAGLRITGGSSSEDPYIENSGKTQNSNLRVKGLAQVNRDLSLEATVWGVRSRQVDYAYGQPTAPYKGITDPQEPRGVDTDVTLGNVTVNYALPIGDLVSSTSYMDHQFDYRFGLPGLTNFMPGFGQWLSTNSVSTRSVSQELRLSSTAGRGTNWIVGLFFQDSELTASQKQGWAALAALNLGPTVYTQGTGTLQTRSLGLFGEVSGEFMKGRLVPTVGVRLYKDERDLKGQLDGAAYGANRTYSSLNPRFNLAYKPERGELYYANIAKGFRSGAQQSKAAADAATAAGLPAQTLMPQDSLWSYEAGAKWDVARRLSIELAAYRIDWKDAQITNLLVGAGGVTTTIISGGNDVQGSGLDFGLVWATPVPGLTLQVSGNVNQTEFTRVPAGTTAKVGDQIPGSPKSSSNVSLTYRTQASGFDWFGHLSYGARGPQTEMTTGKSSDSVRDLRLRLGVGGKSWDASVYGLNLSNQKGVAAVLSSAAVNPIQPRKVGIDANFRF